jgi:hypothetical protein
MEDQSQRLCPVCTRTFCAGGRSAKKRRNKSPLLPSRLLIRTAARKTAALSHSSVARPVRLFVALTMSVAQRMVEGGIYEPMGRRVKLDFARPH